MLTGLIFSVNTNTGLKYYILTDKREMIQNSLSYYFIKIQEHFCLALVKVLLVVLSTIAKFEMKRNFGRSIWRICMTCMIPQLSGTLYVNNWCGGKRIFQNTEKSPHFNNKIYSQGTYYGTMFKMTAIPSSDWPRPITFCPLTFWVPSFLNLFTNSEVSMINRR